MTDAAVRWPGHGVDCPSPRRSRVRRSPPRPLTVAAEPTPRTSAARRPPGAVAGWRSPAAVSCPCRVGYGADIDAGYLLDAGERLRVARLRPVRNPGVPVVEAVVAVLSPLRARRRQPGHRGWPWRPRWSGCARLVRAWGHDNGDVVALAFLASADRPGGRHVDRRLRMGAGPLRVGGTGAQIRGPSGAWPACCTRWPSAAGRRRWVLDRRVPGGRRWDGVGGQQRSLVAGGRRGAGGGAAVRAGVAVVRPEAGVPRTHRVVERAGQQRRPVRGQGSGWPGWP